MNLNTKKLTPRERYRLIGKLIEKVKLRKCSYRQATYISIVKRFLKFGKLPRESLFPYSNKSQQLEAFTLP